MMRTLVVLALGTLAACTAPRAEGQEPPKKVFVCKYVSKPGEAERLQTGQNPISVSVNAIPLDPVTVGSEFADAQGRSVVIAFDTGQPEPSVNDCPPPHPPPTTTTAKPTTTTAAPTTTAKPTTTTAKPHETTTTAKPHETTTTAKPTTTTAKPTTTTTEKPHQTTTTKPPHQTTTTKPHQTTTTRAPTTSTSPTTTTSTPGQTSTSTTASSSTSTSSTSSTTIPRGQLSIAVSAVCPPGATSPVISITFGSRTDLNGQTGELIITTIPGGVVVGMELITYQANQVVVIPYPNTTQNVHLEYQLAGEVAEADVTYPGACATTTTGATTSSTSSTTTTTTPTTTTSGPSTSTSSTTTSSTTTTTAPPTPALFDFAGATTVCRAEVPTIVITFQNTFPELAGRTGTLVMSDINGNIVSTQPLVYQPNTSVDILYPGTTVNPDGSIADVPGWILQPNGLWVRDPSDEFLREGITLTYTVNPTATAFVTYPPESSACANPENPPVVRPPARRPPRFVPPAPPPFVTLPPAL